MRVSTLQVFQQNLNSMLDLQTRAAVNQQQIATGKRILSPADDPAAAARVVELSERISANEQFQRNADTIELRMEQQDSVLSGVGDALQRVRELLLRGKNSSLSPADRRFLASEVRQRLDEITALANSRNGSGEYIFAGTAVTQQPFLASAGGTVAYAGDDTVREQQIAESRRMAEGFPGSEVFMAVRNGNGTFAATYDPANTGTGRILSGAVVDPAAYQAHDFRVVFTGPDTFDVVNDTTATTVLAAQPYVDGGAISFNGVTVQIEGEPAPGDEFSVTPARNQSVFATVDAIADALESTPAGPAPEANLRADLDRLLGELDVAREHLVERRATFGARLNTLDAQQTLNADLTLQLQTVRSELEDMDIVEAVSNLARNTNALEAAQSAFVRVQGLSLFNFF